MRLTKRFNGKYKKAAQDLAIYPVNEIGSSFVLFFSYEQKERQRWWTEREKRDTIKELFDKTRK